MYRRVLVPRVTFRSLGRPRILSRAQASESRSADRIKVTFALPLQHIPGRCSVVGDFNEWVPGSHELRKRANGTRSASVTVPRGTRLRFRYLAEDGTWFNDPEALLRDGADDVVVV